MTGLDMFALLVLFVLLATAVAIWLILGIYPGKIARERNHPQAEAVAVCGWWGVITMGLLLPVALIWAYTKPGAVSAQRGDALDPDEAARDVQDAEGTKS
jgi:hypothetical protein